MFAGIEAEKAVKGRANPSHCADSPILACPVRYTQISTTVYDPLKGI